MTRLVPRVVQVILGCENMSIYANSADEQSKHLAGQIAFLKMMCTRVGGDISDNAVQIFGGRGLTKTGMGKFIEQHQRAFKFDSILGGAEEVLGDLGVRQMMRALPKDQRL